MSLQCMSQLNLKSESFPARGALLILLKCLKKEDGVQFFRQLVPLFYHSCWILSCKKDKTAQKWIRIKASPNIVFIPHIQVFSWSYCEAVRAVEKKAFFRNIFEESRMFWEHISCNLCVESCGCKAQPWTSVSSFFFSAFAASRHFWIAGHLLAKGLFQKHDITLPTLDCGGMNRSVFGYWSYQWPWCVEKVTFATWR